MDKYFSVHHRSFSTPAPVQRYTDTSMPKSKAGSLGRSFTSFYGGQGFISPTRELPRSEKPNAIKINIEKQISLFLTSFMYLAFSSHIQDLKKSMASTGKL